MHEKEVEELNSRIKKLEEELGQIHKQNETSQQALLKTFLRAETGLQEKLSDYDKEMLEKNDALGKLKNNYDKVQEELKIVQGLYDEMMDEKQR